MRVKRVLGILSKKWELEVGEILQPSISVHRYLVTMHLDSEKKWVTGNGWKYAFCCVPDQKRWYAIGLNVEVFSGTFDFSQVAFYDDLQTEFFNLDYVANKTQYSILFPQKLILEPSTINEVAVLITNHAVNGNLHVKLLVEEEDLNPV